MPPDRRFRRDGDIMRKFGLLAQALAAATPAQAEVNGLNISCNEFATAVADVASKSFLQRAGERETAGAGKVLVIAAGNKFFIPSKQADDRSLAPASAWQRIRDWNTAYSDAFWRCKHSDDITLQVQK